MGPLVPTHLHSTFIENAAVCLLRAPALTPALHPHIYTTIARAASKLDEEGVAKVSLDALCHVPFKRLGGRCARGFARPPRLPEPVSARQHPVHSYSVVSVEQRRPRTIQTLGVVACKSTLRLANTALILLFHARHKCQK